MRALGLCVLLGLSTGARGEDVRERLNKIFYWHLSDDLKLTAKQEKEMTVVIQEISARRQSAIDAREAALEDLRKLGKKVDVATASKALDRYRASLVQLSGLDLEEHERLKALFGPETLARYYVVKEEVFQRVREALKQAEHTK